MRTPTTTTTTTPRPIAGRRAALLGWLGLASQLPACSSLLGSPPQTPLTAYALERDTPPGMAAMATAPATARGTARGTAQETAPAPARLAEQRVLLLELPNAAAGYDSARMVYQRQPQTLESFTQSAWVDTPARMLAPLLLRALQNSTGLRAVLQAPSPARSDLRLQTSVLRLQQDFLQPPSRVHFTLQATLTDQRTREVLAWQRFDVTQNATSDDAAGGAAAASLAVQTALQQLALFVQTRVAALPAPAATP
jgi:cholesterol transport system auxiliary component